MFDILLLLTYQLITEKYDAKAYFDSFCNELIVNTGLSDLKFTLDEQERLILIEESWYQSKMSCGDECHVLIGDPTVENIKKVSNYPEQRQS